MALILCLKDRRYLATSIPTLKCAYYSWLQERVLWGMHFVAHCWIVFTNLLDRLNLTIANYVYILEPQWNPKVEEQAIARVYRLGQTRNVKVVRYIVKGTVEEVSTRQKLRTSANMTNLGDAISTSEETWIR